MIFLRQILFTIFSSLLAIASLSQSSSNEKWNLDKNIWSHANYQPGKNNKPVIDFDAIDNWTSLSSQPPIISPNGEYFVYNVQNNLSGELDSIIVQSTVNNWRTIISNDAKPGFFSADSKQYIFQNNIGLCFLQTENGERRYINDILSYETDTKKEWLFYKQANNARTLIFQNLITGKEKRVNEVVSYKFYSGEWLAYQLSNKNGKLINLVSGSEVEYGNVNTYSYGRTGTWFVVQMNDSSKSLVLHNLNDGKEQRFVSVKSYQFFSNENYLLLNSETGVQHVNLINEKKQTIWTTNDTTTILKGFDFDVSGKQVILVTKSKKEESIWYWKEGMALAEIKFSGKIQGQPVFTNNGHYLRFMIPSDISDPGKSASVGIQVDVWSYQDRILQSTQPYLKETKTFAAILHLETGKVMFPERHYEKLGLIIDDYALIIKKGIDVNGDRFWEKGYYEDSVWLMSLKSNSRWLIPVTKSYNSIWFSPDSRYLVYFDAARQCNYFSYELKTGSVKNLSNEVPSWQFGLTNFYLRTSEKPSAGSGVCLWLEADEGFLVYDNYGDIWQLDPSGKKRAECITNGYGHSHNISFSLLNIQGNNKSFIGKDTLLLGAYNRKGKLQGFFRKILGTRANPELMSMDSYFMLGLRNGQYPLKAENTNTWIVNQQNATIAPNYFVTHDFKTFKQLTFLQPHKKYNWLTSELHSFKQLDGTISQGVLYKPENFDSTKKYPLIISFYGTLSDQLYRYTAADYITAPDIFDDPAWMVSHGYLVFIPDIYFIKDQYGPSTVNSIDGAVKYMCRLRYVDSLHIGVVGHSNSGRFGYYLISHSHSFAAMSIGSGFTGANALSGALSLQLGGKEESCLEVAEVTAYGTGLGNIWQNKERWIEHIAPLQADKATSPFLFFHNKKDGDDVRSAIELFIAMRRLEKPTWWLQYDNGGHRVEGDDAKDWTIRYTQFFDHYLKCSPAPRWMTQGIPNNLKGIQGRYELDVAGNCGLKDNSCKICDAWNKQYERKPNMFKKEISEWNLDTDIQQELDKKETERYKKNLVGEAQRIKENNEKLLGK